MLKYDDDVGNFGHDTHKECDVGVAKNSLHHNFILNFCKQIISDRRIKNFLDCDGCSIQSSLVDDAKATLANLLTEFEIVHCDFSNASDGWQTTSSDGDLR